MAGLIHVRLRVEIGGQRGEHPNPPSLLHRTPRSRAGGQHGKPQSSDGPTLVTFTTESGSPSIRSGRARAGPPERHAREGVSG
jgi:hypothetical protein